MGDENNDLVEVIYVPLIVDTDQVNDMVSLQNIAFILGKLSIGFNVVLFCQSADNLKVSKEFIEQYVFVHGLLHTKNVRVVLTNDEEIEQEKLHDNFKELQEQMGAKGYPIQNEPLFFKELENSLKNQLDNELAQNIEDLPW